MYFESMNFQLSIIFYSFTYIKHYIHYTYTHTTGHFDVEVLQKHLITVLQDWEHTHTEYKNHDPLKNLKTENSGLKSGLNSGIKNGIKNTFSDNFNFGLYGNQSTSKKSPAIDMNYIEDLNYYFNEAFSKKLQSSTIFEIVQILTEAFNISQVRSSLVLFYSLPIFSPFLSFFSFLSYVILFYFIYFVSFLKYFILFHSLLLSQIFILLIFISLFYSTRNV